MNTREKLLMATLVAVSIASLATGWGLVGQMARAVDVLTIFAGGMTAGVSLATLMRSIKGRRLGNKGGSS